MRVLILSLSFLAHFAFSQTTPAPYICVPVSSASGPLNAQKIAPINCQFNNGTTVVCYPQSNQTFPQQFPQKIYCYPMPATTTSTTTTTTSTTTTVTTTTPKTTKASSTVSTTTVTSTPSTTTIPEVIIYCIPYAPCGCGENDEGTEAILCVISSNLTVVQCFPADGPYIFSSNPSAGTTAAPEEIACILISGSTSGTLPPTISTTSAPSTTVAPVVCVPYAPIENAEPNEDGISPIECAMLNGTMVVCYPQTEVIFVGPGEIQQRIYCVPTIVEIETTTEVSTTVSEKIVTCIPISECGCGADENGVGAVQCLIVDSGVIVICFPQTSDFVFNQTSLECVIMEGSTSGTVLASSGETSDETEETVAVTETEESTVAPVICVPIARINGSEPNDEGVSPIECEMLNGTIITCYPQSPVIFMGPGEIQQRILCVPFELEEGTTEIATTESQEVVYCMPISSCDCGENEDGVEAVNCLINGTGIVVVCYPMVIDFVFNQSFVDCVVVEGSTFATEETFETVTGEGEMLIECIPFRPLAADSSETNDEGIGAIMCLMDGEFYTCFPENEDFIFNQTSTIECVLLLESTVSPPSSFSTVTVEEDVVECIPFAPANDEEPNEEGTEAIQCYDTVLEQIVICYPQVIDFAFNQKDTIYCVLLEMVTVTTESTESTPESSTISEEIVSCIPVSSYEGDENDQGTLPIKCYDSVLEMYVVCYPTKVDWTYNQTTPVDCVVAPSPAPVECVPIGPSEDGEPDVNGVEPIECQLSDETIIECYPTSVDFTFAPTSGTTSGSSSSSSTSGTSSSTSTVSASTGSEQFTCIPVVQKSTTGPTASP